ncbi:MAG: phosphoadenylyl-sulfate reductase [Gammaproteobacteria bacterium]|nr:phosphoadenylyl-sulfate reductase [Gammaproteobacteria bacterium]
MTADERVTSALKTLPGQHAVSSSFGAQSAVMLHMLTQQVPDIPVIFIDTGYLFPETYQFVDALSARLQLNLQVYEPVMSPAWQEARYGKRWEAGIRGIEEYNQENKVEPMQRALQELNVGTWFSGIRRGQSASRADTQFVENSGGRFKVHPIADWSDKDVYDYLQKHGLPYHPLWEQGYVSIGDVHTTRSLAEVDSLDETRFFGLKRECGIHEMDFAAPAAARSA